MESMVVFFPCIDLEKTKLFYEQIIGLKFYMDQGGCYLFDSNYGYLGFTCNPQKVKDNHPCISFNLKDIKAVDDKYQELLKYDLEMTKPKMHPVFPVYSFFLTDPNGYTVEFQKITKEG